jgi:hypothetical protein
MQNKLKANVDWYSIERMTMTYVSIKFDEETYKHISIRLNKNSARRYLIVDKMFDDLKRIYANSNKMQTTMNAFTRLTQINKYAEFHVFWNEFQRLMKKMNLSKHFLLIELKRKMFYKLQNVMSSEFNIIQDIYELARLTQWKENHYKRIDDVKSRRRSSAVVRSKTKRKLRSIEQWTSLRFRSRSMKKSNRFLSKRRSEILINFESRRFESLLKRLISIRLKRN